MTDKTGNVSRPKRDFPFYVGAPRDVSPIGWTLILLGCALGFAALIVQPQVWPGQGGRWFAVLLFVALPLAGLRIAAGRDWRALFPHAHWSDIWIGLAFVPVTLSTSALVAVFILHRGPTVANPAIGMLSSLGPVDLAMFLVGTLPQLFGEELITVLPLLSTLTLLHRGLKLPRGMAIVGAWAVSALIFAALHLPTYGWHILQTLTIIGMARLALSLPFLITRSIWSSTVAHVANDWLLFALVGGAAALKATGSV